MRWWFVELTLSSFSFLTAFCFRQIQTEAELQIFHVRYFDSLTVDLLCGSIDLPLYYLALLRHADALLLLSVLHD